MSLVDPLFDSEDLDIMEESGTDAGPQLSFPGSRRQADLS